jgi:hypothetical protein
MNLFFMNPWTMAWQEWQRYWWGFFWPYFDKPEAPSLKVVEDNTQA